ncbi:MAG: lipopolysaccharide heptosyltransferase II [Phycisphaerae bacterium]
MPDASLPLAARQFERILLVKPSSLGDVLHGLPVLHFLRRRFPTSIIHWLVAKPLAPLIADQPGIDQLVMFDRKTLGRAGRSWQATGELSAFIKSLRRARYDLVIDLQGLFRSAFFTWISGAPVRIGFREAREGARWLYSHHIPVAEDSLHAVDRNCDVARLFEPAAAPARFDYRIEPESERVALDLIKGIGLNQNAYIALVPGARWETKMWPPTSFAQVAIKLVERLGLRSILLGGPDDHERCQHIERESDGAAVSLAGRTSLAGLAALIRHASCVVCHDSGAMHMAVAMEKPLVCIVGPTNPDRTGPYRRRADVVQKSLDCSPCYLRKLSQCGFEHACMVDLEVDRVVEAAVERTGS